jgi:ribosomal protein S18 acetylase RimI-like enzyme
MRIRTASAGDAAILAPLIQREIECQRDLSGGAFNLASGIDWQAYAQSKLNRSGSVLFVAEKNGSPCGYIEARIVARGSPPSHRRLWGRRPAPSLMQPRTAGIIEDIFVIPDLRGQGIGRELCARAIAWLTEHRATDIEAGIWAANHVSLAFFERMGFQNAKILMMRSVERNA